MLSDFSSSAIRIMSGADQRASGKLFRVATRVVEPFYATAMLLRNAGYQHGLKKSHQLPAFTISIGNITTGGTGKTPIVQWLASRLRDIGRKPAVLLRGYHSSADGISDEQTILNESLNRLTTEPIPVIANPDRVVGSQTALASKPDIDCFILDDGFQHRRVARQFDLVLINATNPFGYDHVLPRGLLREPIRGLRRASAFVITRCNQASADTVGAIEETLQRFNAVAPIYHADHQQTGFVDAITREQFDPSYVLGKGMIPFTGIGDPQSFARQVLSTGAILRGSHFFPDHHQYTKSDIAGLMTIARETAADVFITTEKDWAKVKSFAAEFKGGPPVLISQLAIGFKGNEGNELLKSIREQMKK